MQVELTGADLGAIVTGIDMNTLDERGWKELYQLWLDRHVIIVRDQHFTIEQFLAQGSRFGKLQPHRVRRTRHPDYPELTQMGLGTRKADGKVDMSVYNRGVNWHTDGPWDTKVCKATQLYGLAIPSYGGDTVFANMYSAYDALPDHLKKAIRGLHAEYAYGGRTRQGIDLLEPEDRELPPAVYPVARVHSETGRTTLFINPMHFLRFVELPQDESDALSEEIFKHLIVPNAEYRHKWKLHDYVIWDNRCLLHAATGGYPLDEKRIHWRATITEELQ
jgi:taurine dioxygenase